MTYQQCEEIHDLTVEFCERWIYPVKSRKAGAAKPQFNGVKSWKLKEQMIGAARSAKQNIVEGHSLKSRQGYIRLLGVSRGSLEELLEDYKDFARVRGVELWEQSDARFREMGRRGGKGRTGKRGLPLTPSNPSDPSYPLNHLVDLTNRTCYLLYRQIESLEKKFVEEGGYTENLFKKRLAYRRR